MRVGQQLSWQIGGRDEPNMKEQRAAKDDERSRAEAAREEQRPGRLVASWPGCVVAGSAQRGADLFEIDDPVPLGARRQHRICREYYRIWQQFSAFTLQTTTAAKHTRRA
eukprot:3937816-Prymnesium_polylepis.2